MIVFDFIKMKYFVKFMLYVKSIIFLGVGIFNVGVGQLVAGV